MTNQRPLIISGGYGKRLPSGDLVAPGVVIGITNADLVTQYEGMIVRSSAAGACLLAQADVEAHATNVLGARLSDIASGDAGTVGLFQPGLRVRLAGSATRGEQIYLSAITPGVGVNVAPTLPVLLGYCDNAVDIGGVWYADLVPYQPQPVIGFSSMSWTSAYSNDFTALADQNLITGGDGLKTLSDGSPVYVSNTANATQLAIVAGSGLRITSGTATSTNDGTSPTAYWRLENLGAPPNVALNRREWTIIRCAMIASSLRPVSGSVAYCTTGGFYAVPSGNITNGIPTWTFGITAWLNCQSRNWYSAGNSYEGVPFMGSGGPAQVRTAPGYLLPEGTTPRDLYIIFFTRAEIIVWLSSSVDGDFPSDLMAGAILIGTFRPASAGSYDVAAVYTSAWGFTTGASQTIYVKKLRCEYK